MPDIHSIYRLLQDRFRPARMREFAALFGVSAASRIADVGGDPQNWSYIEVEPQVTLINIDAEDAVDGRFRSMRGDGRDLPFDDRDFDIAYSNSVIEHVGDFRDQQRFACEIRRIADGYYVQTPYRWFPVEPHFLTLLVHFLPKPVYRRLIPLVSVWYWLRRPSLAEVRREVDGVRLLTIREMKALFPDAEIRRERVLGLTKSLIAVRRTPLASRAASRRPAPERLAEPLGAGVRE